MFFNFNLNEILTFPFKDAESRKHLLIGALVSLTAFIIPVLPFFVLTGYAVIIARQVLRGESPRMVAWDDWGALFKNGAKIFGVRLVFTLPILLLILPVIVISAVSPFFISSSSDGEAVAAIIALVVTLSMCILIPVSIVVAVFVPGAEMHAIEKDEFAAGFRFKEWWAIFRANLSGFLAAFGIYYVVSFVVALAIQLLAATVILACLLPLLVPASTIYIMLIMYVTVAQAYKDGVAKLAAVDVVSAG